MKNTPCTTDMKQYACAMWTSIKRPTVRQTVHYELSLLPDKNAASDQRWTLRLGGTHVCPLWKLLLLAAVATITFAIACKCKCTCKQNACDCR